MPEDTSSDLVPIQDELPELIRKLRKPAGNDPQFSSLEAIAVNRVAFTERVHSTWKHLHNRSLDEILSIEKILSSKPRGRLSPDFVWYLKRTIGLWRRINDAIVWTLLGEKDHLIRAVCHHKSRPMLTDANPSAVRRFLNTLNSDPQSIAIWSDATSCVDVGDVLCQSFSGGLSGFFELKAGAMNERILELMDTNGLEQTVSAIKNFADRYGPGAIKQLERVVRQRQRYNQVMDIIEHDRGFDPRRDAEVIIQESTTELESYDQKLQGIIELSKHGEVLRCLDRCLWVWVDRDTSRDPKDKVAAFERELAKTSPFTLQRCREQFGNEEPFNPVALEANLTCPEAIPLFLRPLEPEAIRDVLIGKLMFCVFLFVDWFEMGRIVSDLGAKLTWSTTKRGRREKSKPWFQRPVIVGNRIPRVQLSDDTYLEGFSKIYRVLFEGITPSSIATQYVELLKSPVTRREPRRRRPG